jgi:TetR/AcrR family tetracycline transcriptional repressor
MAQHQTRSTAPPLTRDAIADAGLAVLARDGLDGLSMRKVAAELDVRAASLYWHVRDKQQLLDLLADALLRDLDMDWSGHDWRERMHKAAHCYRRCLTAHRDAIRVVAGRVTAGPNTLRAMESVLSTLREAGFSKGDAAHGLYLIMVAYVQGFVSQETAPMNAAEASGATPEQAMDQLAAEIAAQPKSLYPNVHDNVGKLTMLNLDSRFEFGLERILDGMAQRLATHKPNAPNCHQTLD